MKGGTMRDQSVRLRRTLLLLLLVAAGFAFSPRPARADIIEDFAWVLDQVPGVFPVSGQDIRDSKGFFNELSNVHSDLDVIVLVEKYKDKPVCQKAVGSGGPPSWFWDLVDTYVAFRTDDFWGVVGHLGKAAICIVAQVMTGGAVDVCGLIEDLVKLGQAMLDVAKAVGEFFASVGEGAWEAAKNVGCSLGLGGCGESSPPEQRAYAWVFAPEIPAGLTARKALDPTAFGTLRKQLEADASAQPAKLHIPAPSWLKEYYSAGVVDTASSIYSNAVDAQWTADIAKNVLPVLAAKRSQYDNPQQVGAVAQKAAVEYGKNPKTSPATYVQNLCGDDFTKGFGFAHVDRWIAMFPDKAKGLGDVKPNAYWCGGTFWAKNKDKFGQAFRVYAQTHYCPPLGQTLMCQTVSAYESCTGLLGSVGMKEQCGVNVAAMGKDAAEKIYASLKAEGSKIPCKIVTSGQILGSQPAKLVCPRPTQGHRCEELAKGVNSMASVKLVECPVEETPQYKALRAKVAAAVTSLNQQYPNPPGGIPFLVDLVDPLVVHAPSVDVTAQVQQNNPGFGFGPPSAKPGFDYFTFQLPHTIDGVNTPALGMNVKLPKATQMPQLDKMQEKVFLVKPGDPDPTGTLGSKMQPLAVASPSAVAGPGQMKTLSGSLPPGSAPGVGTPKASIGAAAGNLSAAPGGVSVPKGPDLGGVPAPAPTQGKVPSAGRGAAVPGGSAGAAKAVAGIPPGAGAPGPAPGRIPAPVPLRGSAPPQARVAAGIADIRSGPRVTVAGKYTVLWGQTVTISDADARRSVNGLCDVAILHEAKNAGTAASGPFSRRWVNRQNPVPVTDSFPPIPAGSSVQKTDTLRLKPGVNQLTLTLDSPNLVQEGNEANNTYRLTVAVTGSCGRSAPTPAPGRGVQTVPAAPGTRLPAVQQPQIPQFPIQPRPGPRGR